MTPSNPKTSDIIWVSCNTLLILITIIPLLKIFRNCNLIHYERKNQAKLASYPRYIFITVTIILLTNMDILAIYRLYGKHESLAYSVIAMVVFELYIFQKYFLLLALFTQLYSIFKSTPLRLSKSTNHIFIFLFIIIPLMNFSQPFMKYIRGTLLWTILEASFFLFLIITMICTLFLMIHKLKQAHSMDQQDVELNVMIHKTGLLGMISLIGNILGPIAVILSYQADTQHLNHYLYIRVYVVLLDIYANLICIILSYSFFDATYGTLCGCLETICCSVSVKTGQMNNELPSGSDPKLSQEATYTASRRATVTAKIEAYRPSISVLPPTPATPGDGRNSTSSRFRISGLNRLCAVDTLSSKSSTSAYGNSMRTLGVISESTINEEDEDYTPDTKQTSRLSAFTKVTGNAITPRPLEDVASNSDIASDEDDGDDIIPTPSASTKKVKVDNDDDDDNDSVIPSMVTDNSSFKIKISNEEIKRSVDELTPRSASNLQLKEFIRNKDSGLSGNNSNIDTRSISPIPAKMDNKIDNMTMLQERMNRDVINMQMENDSDSESELEIVYENDND